MKNRERKKWAHPSFFILHSYSVAGVGKTVYNCRAMKCLSLIQPWATLILAGAKEYETRGWSTNYRGPLAIHASRTVPLGIQHLCAEEPFCSALRAAGYESAVELPRGLILGTVQLLAVLPVDR